MTTPATYQASATEADMLATLTEAITRAGGVWYRVNDARMQNMAGFPDILAFVPNIGEGEVQLLGFELKTRRDRQRPAQVVFLRHLNDTVYCRGEIVRAGEPKAGEIDLDTALDLITGGNHR